MFNRLFRSSSSNKSRTIRNVAKPRPRTRLQLEGLEQRLNPSEFSNIVDLFLDDPGTGFSAIGEGLGEGAENIYIGAVDTVHEVRYTAEDLHTIYTSVDDLNPDDMISKLFKSVAQTTNPADAVAFDNYLIYSISTLGIGPLVESGYNAIKSGDSTEFSQQAGGFGAMVILPYAGIKGISGIGGTRIPVLALRQVASLEGAGGRAIAPGVLVFEWIELTTITVPAEANLAIGGTGAVFAMAMDGPGQGGGQAKNVDVDEVKGWSRTENPDWLDQNAIAEIKAKLEANDPDIWKDPIQFTEIDGKTYVIDGHHRLTAMVEIDYDGNIQVHEISPPADLSPGDHFGPFVGE